MYLDIRLKLKSESCWCGFKLVLCGLSFCQNGWAFVFYRSRLGIKFHRFVNEALLEHAKSPFTCRVREYNANTGLMQKAQHASPRNLCLCRFSWRFCLAASTIPRTASSPKLLNSKHPQTPLMPSPSRTRGHPHRLLMKPFYHLI